ncbi:MAG: DUF1697 domain-containing protein [Balneolales bacterium]
MNTYVALFRGINVGGNNILPMKELRGLLENLGLQNISTYIQSGNVVFQTKEDDVSKISEMISGKIEEKFNFRPWVLLLKQSELEDAITSNPFPEAEADPSRLHLNFLASEPENPDMKKLDDIKKESENFKLTNSIFYLNAPEGIGRSKLAASAEKLLGVPLTSRNWRTVQKIMAIINKNG